MKKSILYLMVGFLFFLNACNSFANNCTTSGYMLTCGYQTISNVDGIQDLTREVYYHFPESEMPVDGWPVVIDFTGTGVSAQDIWSASRLFQKSLYNHVRVIEALLDNGYAVVAPQTNPAPLHPRYWETNAYPYVQKGVDNYVGSPDDNYMMGEFNDVLLNFIDGNNFFNTNSVFLMGISSGGYMSSRIGISPPGSLHVKAIAIQSASYAAWSGSNTEVPLPAAEDLYDHPPVIFLHGESDTWIVPIDTVLRYANHLSDSVLPAGDVLLKQGNYGHMWADDAYDDIVEWFNKYK